MLIQEFETSTKDIFVGRKKQLELFQQMINTPGEPWLMLITGSGGDGKTILLTHFAELCETSELSLTNSGIIDFYNLANRRKIGILTALQDSLGSRLGRIHFSGFTATVNRYDQLVNEGQVTGWDEVELAEERAIAAFMRAYQKLADKQRLVLLFDTFEEIADLEFGSWFLFELLPNLQKNSIIVIAGRRAPSWQDKFRENEDIYPISLPTLTSQEMKEYYKQAGVTIQDPLASRIAELSHGHPLLLALTVDWLREEFLPYRLDDFTQDNPEKYEELLVERIQHLKKHEHLAILGMAHVYHRFDAQILSSLYTAEQLDGQKPEQIIHNLSRFSFIKYWPDSGNCLLHDEMRRLVTRYIWDFIDQDQATRREISMKALAYYEEKLAEAKHKPEQERDQREIDALTQEFWYHKLYSDMENSSVDYWDTLDQIWHSYRYDFIDDLLRVGREINAKRSQPDKVFDRLEKTIRAWVLQETWRIEEALALANEVISDPAEVKRFQATATAVRGLCLDRKGESLEAIEALNEAYLLYNDLYNALVAGDPLSEEKGFATLKGIRPERTMILNALGYIYRVGGRFARAMRYYSQALELSQAEGNKEWEATALSNLAQVHRWQGNIQDAFDLAHMSLHLRQQLDLRGDEGISYNILSLIYRDDGNYRKAQELSFKALDIFKETKQEWRIGMVLRNMGWVSHLDANYDIAHKHYQQAFTIFERIGARQELPDLFHKIGRLHFVKNDLQQARQYYEKSLEIAKDFNNLIFVANSLVDLSRVAYQSELFDLVFEYEQEVRSLEKQGYSFFPTYARMEFVLGDLAEKRHQLDDAFDHYGQGYAYLGRHNEWRLNAQLDFVREKLLELPPEKRRHQAKRLADFWNKQEDLVKQYPYFLTMCQRYAEENAVTESV